MRRRNNNKKNTPRYSTEAGALTSENTAAWRTVRAFRGPNNKYINSLYNGISLTPVATAPGVFLLNGVAQGTTENSRLGRLARHLWLDMDLDIYLGSSATTFWAVRIYIVVETTALGSALAPAQFFVDNSTFTAMSQRDRTNRNASRYLVLYDSKPMTLGSGASTGTGSNPFPPVVGVSAAERFISLHIPLNFDTDYSRGNTGTITDIDTNSLYLIAVTDNSTASEVYVNGGYTVCFNDTGKA